MLENKGSDVTRVIAKGWCQMTHMQNVKPVWVSDIMSTPVLTVDVADTLWDAWQMLFVSGRRHLAVVDHDACIGVISDRALLSTVTVSAEKLTSHKVGDIISRTTLPFVSSATCISEAVELMRTHMVEALPVIDEGRLIGILTSTDLIPWAATISAAS